MLPGGAREDAAPRQAEACVASWSVRASAQVMGRLNAELAAQARRLLGWRHEMASGIGQLAGCPAEACATPESAERGEACPRLEAAEVEAALQRLVVRRGKLEGLRRPQRRRRPTVSLECRSYTLRAKHGQDGERKSARNTAIFLTRMWPTAPAPPPSRRRGEGQGRVSEDGEAAHPSRSR